jgi:hypothetical protein
MLQAGSLRSPESHRMADVKGTGDEWEVQDRTCSVPTDRAVPRRAHLARLSDVLPDSDKSHAINALPQDTTGKKIIHPLTWRTAKYL